MSVPGDPEFREELEAAAAEGATPAELAGMAASFAAGGRGTIGQCRIGTEDWAELYPVLDRNGLRFCCTHQPQHCTEPIARLRP